VTLIIGWRDRDRSFLVSDTAVTKPGNAIWGRSSFGEAPHNIAGTGRVVEEGVAKISILEEAGCAAICGAVDPAIEFIRDLRDHDARQDLAYVLSSISNRLKSETQAPFQLLITRPDELVHFGPRESPQSSTVPSGEAVAIGNVPDETRKAIQVVVKQCLEYENPDDQLVLIIAKLQMLGLQIHLPGVGIGGAFYGCYVDAGGIHWIDDTLFLIVPPKSGPKRGSPPLIKELGIASVVVAVRDGWVCRDSSLLDEENAPAIRVLVPPEHLTHDFGWPLEEKRWLKAWSTDVREVMGKKRVRYLVLLSNIYQSVTVIDLQHSEPGKFMALKGDQAAFNPNLIDGFQGWRPSEAEPTNFRFFSSRAFSRTSTP
jgi:hypothetical protein